MVATRSASSPVKRTPSAKRSATPSKDNSSLLAPPALTPGRTRRASTPRSGHWSHTPSNLSLIWLAISLPLTIWDFCYMLLRPRTLPGGSLHWPLWAPYAKYGTVDRVYSTQAWNDGEGWGTAQSVMNVVETAGYLGYLWIVATYGAQEKRAGRGAPKNAGFLGLARTVSGDWAGVACLLGFGVTMLTWSKTALYFMTEGFSGFAGVKHNDWFTLTFFYLVPSGPWLIIPSYLAYVYGAEILQGLSVAAGGKKLQ